MTKCSFLLLLPALLKSWHNPKDRQNCVAQRTGEQMLKTEYKFIFFKDVQWEEDGAQREGWYCFSKRGDLLGRIGFYPRWKKYVFSIKNEDVLFDNTCLKDVAHFLEQLDKAK